MTTRPRPRGRASARDLRAPADAPTPVEGLGAAPWARVRRVQLIRREVREVLSPSAVDVLFEHAELVVEGGEELGGRRGEDRRVFATVMVTVDLARCAGQVREPADEATARRVAELMQAEPRVHARLRSLAASELARLGGAEPEPSTIALEIALRVQGTAVLIDIDAMATLARLRE